LITITASIIANFIRPDGFDKESPPPTPDRGPDVIYPDKKKESMPQREAEKPTTESGPSAKIKLWNEILDDFVRNLSDQQLSTSLALLITAFIRRCQISNYHLNIVCDLAWFSTVTHLLSVIVLRVYWMHKAKRIVLHIRVALMVTVAVMLCTAMVLSSPIDPIAGKGACPAHCSFDHTEVNTIFHGGSLSVLPGFSNFGGLMLFIVICWGYATTCLFVAPYWWRAYRFFLWCIPGFFFKIMGCLAEYAPNPVKVEASRWIPFTLRMKISNFFARLWQFIFFPSPTWSVIVQILSWGFAIVPLRFDRWGGNRAISNQDSESQWGFGQLLAMIIVVLPVLPLLETWSGKSHTKIIF
jgi:hypothetical protein